LTYLVHFPYWNYHLQVGLHQNLGLEFGCLMHLFQQLILHFPLVLILSQQLIGSHHR
ncbi:conserved hypothetical protein, partial [Listeria ivanovii FSL F6-596]